ncbi:hypothetical protein BGZ59_007206 [Podila verticillata]|nr:hypothetical protein BGZ59_007206 [Podila verticillata]
MIGNSGAGKSMQLSQLGVTTFPSGNRLRMGFTKDVYEKEIELNGQRVFIKSLDTEQDLLGFKFDITVDSVIFLMFSNDGIINQRFKDTIPADVCQRSQYEIKMAS